MHLSFLSQKKGRMKMVYVYKFIFLFSIGIAPVAESNYL